MANRTKWTPKKKKEFLEILAAGGSVAKAATAVGICRQYPYQLRENDEAFTKEWNTAVEAGTDILEDEAFRRAFNGVEKPVGFHQGEHMGTMVREYSDTLTIFLLKGRRPEKFKERAEVDHKGGLTIHQFLDEIPDHDDKR